MTNYLKICNNEERFTIDWVFKGNGELLYFSSRGGSDGIWDISIDFLCPDVCLRFCYILIVVQFNLLFKFTFKVLRHSNFLEIFTVVFSVIDVLFGFTTVTPSLRLQLLQCCQAGVKTRVALSTECPLGAFGAALRCCPWCCKRLHRRAWVNCVDQVSCLAHFLSSAHQWRTGISEIFNYGFKFICLFSWVDQFLHILCRSAVWCTHVCNHYVFLMDCFIVMQYLSLLLAIFFALKSILSDINTPSTVFALLILA